MQSGRKTGFELVKLDKLSGNEATIYSILFPDTNLTSFDKFVNENKNEFKSELSDIRNRLIIISAKTGARDIYFKLNEGNPGDGVCALFDKPGRKLRLYCIRYGSVIVIVGGGGRKNVMKLQADRKLKEENFFLRYLSEMISERIRNKEIWYSENEMEFEGNLKFNVEEDD